MRKIQHYFQGRSVKVFIEHLLKKVLDNGHESNRLAQWSSFLSIYCIIYEPRKVEKCHAIASLLAHFLVEYVSYKEQMIVASLLEKVKQWLIYTKGSHGRLGLKTGCLIVTPDGKRIEKVIRLGFKALNNEAEYEVAIYALTTAKVLGVKHI